MGVETALFQTGRHTNILHGAAVEPPFVEQRSCPFDNLPTRLFTFPHGFSSPPNLAQTAQPKMKNGSSGIPRRSRPFPEDPGLPGQFLTEVNKSAIRTIGTKEREVDAGLGAFGDLHGSLVGAHFRLHPAWVSRIHLDFGVL